VEPGLPRGQLLGLESFEWLQLGKDLEVLVPAREAAQRLAR
jgi:hypothetical protein